MPTCAKFLLLFLVPLCFAACTGSTPSTPTPAVNDSAVAATVTLPYTATYSSIFVPGKQADVATVLESYKAWEINDMKRLRATFSDSIMMDLPKVNLTF